MDDKGDRGSQRRTQAEPIQPHRHWCLPFCSAKSRDVWSRGPRGLCSAEQAKTAKYAAKIAEYTAGIGSVSKKLFMENAMRDLSITLCRGVARQAIASMQLQARMDGKAVLPGLRVPTHVL